MVEEVWKVVPGFSKYLVSNLGRASGPGRAKNSGRVILKPAHRDEYPYVTMWTDDGIKKTVRLHRAVCLAFNGPAPSASHEVAHNNGNRADACADNLRWDTRSGNHADKIMHGTSQCGERNGNSKLTAKMVQGIRATYHPGIFGSVKTSRLFGVSKSTVLRIVNRAMWAHVHEQSAIADLLEQIEERAQ